MEISKKQIFIFVGILLIGLWFVGILFTYQQTRKEPPIIFAKIPTETIDFFKKIASLGGDIWIHFNPNPDPKNWENSENLGENPKFGFVKLEDRNFIIYYHNDIGFQKASKAMQYANQAIVPLKDLFGRYYFPQDVNNRKLAIYLTSTRDEYYQIGKLLCEGDLPDFSIGVTALELSHFGWLTKGIVLAPGAVTKNSEYFRQVLWHEMAHYVHFTSLDASKPLKLYSWIIEGIAEYFSDARERIFEVNIIKLKGIYLNQDLKNYTDAYWVGYTVFLYMEKDFYKETIKKFLHLSYSEDPVPYLPSLTHISVSQFGLNWKNFTMDLVNQFTLNKEFKIDFVSQIKIKDTFTEN